MGIVSKLANSFREAKALAKSLGSMWLHDFKKIASIEDTDDVKDLRNLQTLNFGRALYNDIRDKNKDEKDKILPSWIKKEVIAFSAFMIPFIPGLLVPAAAALVAYVAYKTVSQIVRNTFKAFSRAAQNSAAPQKINKYHRPGVESAKQAAEFKTKGYLPQQFSDAHNGPANGQKPAPGQQPTLGQRSTGEKLALINHMFAHK